MSYSISTLLLRNLNDVFGGAARAARLGGAARIAHLRNASCTMTGLRNEGCGDSRERLRPNALHHALME